MARIAFIGGFGTQPEWKGFHQRIVRTKYGNVLLYEKGNVIHLPRHGAKKTIPPHRIEHRANICALHMLGCERIVSLNSCGSLRESIKPGTLLIASDFVHLDPPTFFDMEIKGTVPKIDENTRKIIKKAAKDTKVAIRQKGVYVQTKGPRFETPAEIKVIKRWGDIVGMTMGSEATLACELNLPYASLCHIDNYANGITKSALSMGVLKKHQKSTQKKVMSIVKRIIKDYT